MLNKHYSFTKATKAIEQNETETGVSNDIHFYISKTERKKTTRHYIMKPLH